MNVAPIRRFVIAVFCMAVTAGAFFADAQVVPSAAGRRLSITAGAMGSMFQPDYQGGGVAQASPYWLFGMGAYVDVKFSRWVQVEAEGRWLRFNPYFNITQDNYLIGPRLPIPHAHIWRATPYGKVLFGYGRMNFENNTAWGRFTDIAYGAGVDVKVTKRISVRAIDFEYQQWPSWLNSSLAPYGFSAGVGYRVF